MTRNWLTALALCLSAACSNGIQRELSTLEVAEGRSIEAAKPPEKGSRGDGGAREEGGAPDDASGPDSASAGLCGDGKRDPGEACDDGEANSNEEPGACRLDCSEATCGDGVVDEGEECDTGELLSDTEPDACRSDCKNPTCGDGVPDPSLDEACDTGDELSDTEADACRTDCTKPRCGDGVVDSTEQCEPSQGSSCNAQTCTLPTCGNGKLDTGEECDPAMDNEGPCRNNCKKPTCGDGIVDADLGEECDDNNAFDNDGCLSNCKQGCVSARDCYEKIAYCDGSQCVDGQCTSGPVPETDDRIACTVGTCDNAKASVIQTPDNELCRSVKCEEGVEMTYGGTCSTTDGCIDTTLLRSARCPAREPTCLERDDGAFRVTFTPACANDRSCQARGLATEEPCPQRVCRDGTLLGGTPYCDGTRCGIDGSERVCPLSCSEDGLLCGGCETDAKGNANCSRSLCRKCPSGQRCFQNKNTALCRPGAIPLPDSDIGTITLER